MTLAASIALALPALARDAAAQDAAEQIANGGFDDALAGWDAYPVPSAVDGRGCIDVPAGAGAYGAGFGQTVPMVEGETYALSFEASSEPANAGDLRVVVQGGEDVNYLEFMPSRRLEVAPGPRRLDYTFTAPRDYATALVAFQQDNDNDAAYRLCLDDVSLTGGAEPVAYVPDTGSAVRVNQVGYAVAGPKRATVVSDATDPRPWELRGADGQVVARGRTEPFGPDASSGLDVHRIAFDAVRDAGEGYTLVVGDATSHPFRISADLYGRLRRDAKRFYYTNRSGIAIDGALAPGYARAAGHVGEAPNLGDVAVPCLALDDDAQRLYAEPWTCEGVRDVTGGWYDAGDHGKYVVNAGISVAQLLMEFERTVTGTSDPAAYADGSLPIPEAGNGVPDLLDEVRWELDWMLKMQVPAGRPLAGMANHKVADVDWTGLPLLPAEDPQRRALFRPSTAATLNLAAVAAQGARLYAPYDRAFADELLGASRAAWTAARETPDLHAPPPDPELDPNPGSGPYDDDDAGDELYWAAAELWLTTGETAFRDALESSPHHAADVFADGFDWKETAALGRLDLASVASELPDAERVRRSVIDAADRLLDVQGVAAFGQTYAPPGNDWAWGSNSAILNNLQVIGTAHDLSGEARFADGVLRGLDYLFGGNALNLSYVTGYGDAFARNQHSRWYAASLDPDLPHPPAGTVAGGPNSTAVETGDPVAMANLAGCVGQSCYIDDIGSWSTNEITINWNASLSWVAAAAADLGR